MGDLKRLPSVSWFAHPWFSPFLIAAFTCLKPPGTYRGHDLSELILDGIDTFLTTQGHRRPPRTRDQLNAGATSETTWTWMTIHNVHAPIHSNKANMSAKWYCGPKASDICLTGEEKPRKNPPRKHVPTGDWIHRLRDRLACYRLLHSGGLQLVVLIFFFFFQDHAI